MTGFCETTDVQHALQETDTKFGSGALGTDVVEPAIEAASRWFANATNGYWYDSTAAAGDLIDSSAASATAVRLDVPSSPHRQDRQVFRSDRGVRYPVTTNGPYARIRLPHPYVESLTALEVRDTAGGIEDWTSAGSDKVEGRGEDYYIDTPGQQSYGATYLYIRAASIGSRVDFGGLLTLDYQHGLDYQDTAWDDVRKGIASLAAAEVIDDDSVLTQIPDNARLAGIDTQQDQLMNRASKYLDPHRGVAVR